MFAAIWLLLLLCHVTQPALHETEADAQMQQEVSKDTGDADKTPNGENGATDKTQRDETPPAGTEAAMDKHGGVKMGEIRQDCDDLQWNLELDWDNSTNYEYTCQTEQGEQHIGVGSSEILSICLEKDSIPAPTHVCMNAEIVYEDEPPTAGPHRPNWPSFGTYTYVPAQRWVHSLEHGSVVMLYHPCADAEQVAILASIVRSCIRKHVITPYRYLPQDQPLALVTYGCKLLMGRVNQQEAIKFIKDTAMKTEESAVTMDGLYKWGQLQKADIVSDIEDSELCPAPPIHGGQLPIAENMESPYTPQKVSKEQNKSDKKGEK